MNQKDLKTWYRMPKRGYDLRLHDWDTFIVSFTKIRPWETKGTYFSFPPNFLETHINWRKYMAEMLRKMRVHSGRSARHTKNG